MSRALALLVLVTTAACGPAPRPISPVAAPPRAEGVLVTPRAQPGVTYHLHLQGPGLGWSEGMPVVVPDTESLERMPVLRPDTSIDRRMVARGNGSSFRLRGPATVEPSPDSTLRIAPRP